MHSIQFAFSYRAMFKLGAKIFFLLLCLLFKNMPAVYSVDRCNFEGLKLIGPGIETICIRAQLKEHSIVDRLAVSDLQIIATGRS